METGRPYGALGRGLSAIKKVGGIKQLVSGFSTRDELQPVLIADDALETVAPITTVPETAFSIFTLSGPGLFGGIRIVNSAPGGIWIVGIELEDAVTIARVGFEPFVMSTEFPLVVPVPLTFRGPPPQWTARFGSHGAGPSIGWSMLSRAGSPVSPLEKGPIYLPPGNPCTVLNTVANANFSVSFRIREVPT